MECPENREFRSSQRWFYRRRSSWTCFRVARKGYLKVSEGSHCLYLRVQTVQEE